MARWEPNARMRLVKAAIELFTERGYDNTSAAEIAARAGLTKATFFRHFPEKREVLFAGRTDLSRLMVEGVSAVPEGAAPMDMIRGALDAATSYFVPEQRPYGPLMRTIVDRNPELIEREAYKHQVLRDAMAGALTARGVSERTATVAAELGITAFYRAYDAWCLPDNTAGVTDLARQELNALLTAASVL